MKRIAFLLVVLLACAFTLSACSGGTPFVPSGIDTLDLSVMPDDTPPHLRYLFASSVVDDTLDYLGHPDAIELPNGNLLAMYPEGHGKGAVRTKLSKDGGLTWVNNDNPTPESWKNSRETPTVYRLNIVNEEGVKVSEKLLMTSANPKWPDVHELNGDGFHATVSTDGGITWSEFEKFYGKQSSYPTKPIVAMASLVQLKENGKFVNKWMGIFHDNKFYNYSTILTFNGEQMVWSTPTRYFEQYRKIEKSSKMCEVLMMRSNGGTGDELVLISRSNSKNINSLISFSTDEGKTWSEPKEVNSALNGERHKALILPDGRLFITFRSIERDERVKELRDKKTQNFYSHGWVAWVGTYDDLKNGTKGQYRIKLAHTYLNGQTEPTLSANADTGYAGNVLLADGTIVTMTYGRFSPADKTYILSKRLNIQDIDALFLHQNSGV